MERHIKAATTNTSGTRRVGRVFRNRLALTTILTVAPLVGYGRPALAASGCHQTGGTTYLCGGTNGATLEINADNATVSTAAGFSVNAAAGNSITITGEGKLTFTDANASPITSANANGLEVRATSNYGLEGEGGIVGEVMIETNGNITGGRNGIYAENEGSGNLSVTVGGAVTGQSDSGILARNNGKDLTITTGAQSGIIGEGDGIVALNKGGGNLDILVNGRVNGRNDDGIVAENGYNDGDVTRGVNLTVRTGAQSRITGASDGILATNIGSGKLEITADGAVYGEDDNGIQAENSRYGTDLAITTGAQSIVEGDEDGIVADNRGAGDLDITVNGRVEGLEGDGIQADNGFYDEGGEDIAKGLNLTVRTGAQSVVTGRGDGIAANNRGNGRLDITVNGAVTAGDDGIEADNSRIGTELTITTGVGSVVRGRDDGINADQDGDGDLTIVVNGRVTGGYVDEEEYGGDGIYAENDGSGETIVIIEDSGLVQGYDSAIDLQSSDGQYMSITNFGEVRNLSGNSARLAIETNGGDTNIRNNGVLIGTVRLGIENEDFDEFTFDRLVNAGLWNTAGGENFFGAGKDRVVNSGMLIAANDAAQVEETDFFGLENFDNTGGLISLVDGAVGDTLRLFGEVGGEGEGVGVYDDRNLTYLATDGRLAVDAVLGDGEAGKSDILEIYGSVRQAETIQSDADSDIGEGGITWVSVNVLDVLGANLDGIPVVKVMGNTGEGDFQLDGPLYAGFYAWDMRYDRRDDVHELYTSGVGVGAYEFAAGITGAQDMWFQSTGLLMQRQADLRPLIAGMQVTPVADFAQPVEATPVAKVLPGFWMRGVGAWLERDDEQDGFTLDRTQTVFGGMAGFDFGTENVAGQGDALIFGLFGGYLTSKLDFKETNSEWSYQGPSLGVYASYLTGAFYADATVKADFLDISIDPEDLAPAADESDTDGLNIGAMLDAGYKFGSGGGVFFEPQATLALLHTSIDDVDVFGGTVEFDNETSLRGRLGMRLGYDHTAGNAVVYSSDVTASVWQNFSGENGATIVDPLIPAFGVADDPARTYGDVSLGFSATAPEGWTGFLRGNYQFGDGYEAFAGNAGVRVAW